MAIKESTYKKYCLVIDEWVTNGWNGTQAYKKHYQKASDEVAANMFSEIVRIREIKEYIKEKHEKAQTYLQTTHERILEELRNWAYSDITETISLTPDEIKELPLSIRRLITKYKETSRDIKNNDGEIIETIKVVELWFVSKEKAMEMIHKHTGFYEKDNTQKQSIIKGITIKEV